MNKQHHSFSDNFMIGILSISTRPSTPAFSFFPSMLENIRFPKNSAATPNPSCPIFNYPSHPLSAPTALKNSSVVGAGGSVRYGLFSRLATTPT